MRVLVTGASGFIGVAVLAELLQAGHDVVGLARSDDAAATVQAAGAETLLGDVRDAAVLARGAAGADAVIHLAYNHAPTASDDPAAQDLQTVQLLGDCLAGSQKALVIASGVLGLAPGRVVTEHDMPGEATAPALRARAQTGSFALGLARRGVRVSVVRLAPSVHDSGAVTPGFAGQLVELARATGVAGYPGDGSSRWCAVHRVDAARLFRLALNDLVSDHPATAPEPSYPDAASATDSALDPAGGTLWHGVSEQAVTQREIAQVISDAVGVPARSVPAEQAEGHFGWLAPLVQLDAPASSHHTREQLGWQPTHPGLLADLRADILASRAR